MSSKASDINKTNEERLFILVLVDWRPQIVSAKTKVGIKVTFLLVLKLFL